RTTSFSPIDKAGPAGCPDDPAGSEAARGAGSSADGQAVVGTGLPGLDLGRVAFIADDALPLHLLLGRQADAALPGRVGAGIGQAHGRCRAPVAQLADITHRVDAVAPLGGAVV